MKYLERSFTLPSSQNTSQGRWDAATLTSEQFFAKYGMTPEGYFKSLEYPCGAAE